MPLRTLPLLALLALFSGSLRAAPGLNEPAGGAGAMAVYPTKYYIIHSDLPVDDVKEAVLRMTRMAEEYHARTQGFSGDIRERMPFFLFKNADEYYKAGGLPGSAGVFNPNDKSLMAIAGDETKGQVWHIVQHEGFHQFAHFVIRGELPTWLNEGIAEYFGESVFTGDGFVTGVIPPSRLKRLQEEIKSNQLKSIKDMMFTSHADWNSRLAIENYDQAWSMVHFLAQGEGGKYQQPFVAFMKAIGRGTPWENAWRQTFGDAAGFEQRWKDYWLSLPPKPTTDLYVQAATSVFTSFLARSATQKETFDSFEEFLTAAKEDHVKTGQTIDDWLPPQLLHDLAEQAGNAPAKWKIERVPSKSSQLVADLEDGTRMVGSFVIRSGHITQIGVEVDDTGPAIKQAQSLIDAGKKEQARTILQQALRAHPKSPLADDVRKLILQTK